jgi:hypothetical protein
MIEQKKERWSELCELAAVEQDPHKLHELAKELLWVLEAREQQSQQLGWWTTDERTLDRMLELEDRDCGATTKETPPMRSRDPVPPRNGARPD